MNESILSIFDELASTTKSKEKISILKEQQSNNLLKTVFETALDPYRSFNIRKIPTYTHKEKKFSLEYFISELPKFESRALSGHAAVEHLSILLSYMDPSDATVAERILKNDMRCGVSKATVNKIWKNLIPTYPCLLGHAYTDKMVQENIAWPAYAQIKADGMRANAFVSSSEAIVIKGRSGKTIDILGSLDTSLKEIISVCGVNNVVFDGELIVVDSDGSIMPRKQGNGILNKAIKGTISSEEARNVKFRIWDIIPIENFHQMYYDVPYYERISKLENFFNNKSLQTKLVLQGSRIEVIETREVNNYAEVEEYFKESLTRGEEGIMLKDRSHIWENKRSKQVVKFKSEKECDLKIVGWNEGTGKNIGILGALVCESACGQLSVQVGSGYSDEQRESFGKEMIGKTVTVRFNEVIESSGTFSLFLPRFIEERFDTSPDSFDHIKDM